MKHFFIPSLKQIIFLLLSLSLALFVMVVAFSSCSPNNQTNEDSTVGNTDGDDTGGNRRTTNNDRCTDDVGDKCKGNESCEQVCESIYEEWDAQRSCMDRGDETVGKLQKIHNRLMGKKAGQTKANGAQDRTPNQVDSDIREISDEEEGIEVDDFKCYLQIGADKYISEIKKGLVPEGGTENNKRNNLIETLQWFVEQKDVAEVLSELSTGDDILEKLLLTLADDGPDDIKDCITGLEYRQQESCSGNDNPETNNWYLDNNLKVCIKRDNNLNYQTIELHSDDRALYKALSCFHGGDINGQNIFVYATEEQNEHILELSFELLNGICNNIISSKDNGQDKACARALMCWSAWQSRCSTRGNNNGCKSKDPNDARDFWEEVKQHEGDLENSGSSNYDECDAQNMADLFGG